VLYEIADDGPGFGKDEDLGRQILLPPWYESHRTRIESMLTPIPDPRAGWLALAMSSTLAGNLTITGSVANIIVVERASAEGVHVGFREYFRVGLPVTLATLALGSAWLWIAR